MMERRGTRPLRVVFCTTAILGLAAGLSAQTLGEAARKEQERRTSKGASPPCKTFTEDDLLTYRGAREEAPPLADKGAAPSPSVEPPVVEHSRAQEERRWRAHAQDVRRAVAQAAAEVERLERKPGGGG